MDIEELRKEIDGIDKELVSLFVKRMDVAAEVAAFKKENGRPVLDPERERKLLEKVSDLAGKDMESQTRILYHLILSLSRSHQSHLLGLDCTLTDKITKAIDTTDKVFPERAIVACQGVEGAYSQFACEKLFGAPSIMYMNTFEGVFQAVDKGLCRYGILPLENSTAGSVNQIYDLMRRYQFHIVRSTRVHVPHVLLAKKGVRFEDVREIYSHEQAIQQCSAFLQKLKNVKIHVCENTAMAAKAVAESDRTDVAAISSDSCAALYGLDVLETAVSNVENNYTRFICISKNLEVYPGAHRTSLMLTLPHKPGSLYTVIAKFYSLGVNLIKLESRPIPGKDFEFMFYFDIDVSVYSKAFTDLLCQLQAETETFRYLGSYTEIV
ncbi:MAG: chorismate mutase [Clostridia bacterium]|nr:chorismate mutase [Clostridia bacterium]